MVWRSFLMGEIRKAGEALMLRKNSRISRTFLIIGR